ncbi:uncharacterized protein F4812DRAFT_429020 [Daldinia caldariorum]|uniref:uncharacterized protein n=1 Tax=Daldinia caldariorum TaxID=326644 RepID=UPI002007253B|nr:uncharacterized protein F4812DRAFT_429020 [Daldinia caldariorum]KAI1468125.1 hypothetical protein F4812DRAFT_429020 [Daldinia caldariorum]
MVAAEKPTSPARPLGPAIAANMADGFCGVNLLHVTRVPVVSPGKAGWLTLLAMLNPDVPALDADADRSADMAEAAEKGGGRESAGGGGGDGGNAPVHSASWSSIAPKPLQTHQSRACVVISRTTLITMLVMTNARPVFQYSEAAGFRAGYASYCGQWYITWPIGQEAIVTFAAHDSLGSGKEVFPRGFPLRVDRCARMIAGVVASPTSDFAVGFGGRQAPGTYVLEHAPRGFPAAHSGRHLYNMLGGRAFDVDYLYARPDRLDNTTGAVGTKGVRLHLPDKTAGNRSVAVVVPPAAEAVLKQALDTLPWTSLSWSMHRGLRDVLLAYGRQIMDLHRTALAALLRQTVASRAEEFVSRGWDGDFVRESMGPMAAAAVLAGRGDSGDAVRVVTAAAAVYYDAAKGILGSGRSDNDSSLDELDEVRFWRAQQPHRRRGSSPLLPEAVVALTKFFVLEWSQEFDYQLYHHLPMSLYFG